MCTSKEDLRKRSHKRAISKSLGEVSKSGQEVRERATKKMLPDPPQGDTRKNLWHAGKSDCRFTEGNTTTMGYGVATHKIYELWQGTLLVVIPESYWQNDTQSVNSPRIPIHVTRSTDQPTNVLWRVYLQIASKQIHCFCIRVQKWTLLVVASLEWPGDQNHLSKSQKWSGRSTYVPPMPTGNFHSFPSLSIWRCRRRMWMLWFKQNNWETAFFGWCSPPGKQLETKGAKWSCTEMT